MWLLFLAATLCAIAFLIVPGFVVARSFSVRWELALGFAPILTVAQYGVLSIVYGAFGIP